MGERLAVYDRMYKCCGSGTVEGNVGITGAGYGIRTERSREIFERLERSVPGGNTLSLAFFPPYPPVIFSGSGCRIRDAGGNEFIDLLNNYTASVHGHALPAINEAMSNQAGPWDRLSCPQRAASRSRGTDRRPRRNRKATRWLR